MVAHNKDCIDNRVDLPSLGITFAQKPLIIGGLAMEYYGMRKAGDDVDFIVANEDYLALADKYPDNRKDKWGDLGVAVNNLELLRSIFRLDYDFYSEGATEYEKYKVISFEKLLFMKVLAFDNQPEIERHTNDYKLIMQCCLESFQNKDYAQNAEKYLNLYLSSPDGTVYRGEYDEV